MDGFDTQIFALTVPAIMKDWGAARTGFTVALTLGLLSAAIGSAVGGVLGDRVGRRPVLIGAALLFTAATAGLAAATDLTWLAALRFASGLGLGAAMPNASSLIAELTSPRRRGLAITLGATCVGAGGVLSGVVAGLVLPTAGWRALFVSGASLGGLVAALIFLVVPESPAFADERGEKPAPGSGGLLDEGRRVDTFALWGVSVFAMFGTYSLLSWLPAILGEAGRSLAEIGLAMSILNLGGVASGVLGALAIAVFGVRRVILGLALVGGLSSLALVFTGVAGAPLPAILTLFAVQGGCVSGVVVALYPLAADIYPPRLRARGIGLAVGLGRTAAVASPLLAGYLLERLGQRGFYTAIFTAMALCTLSSAIVLKRRTGARPDSRSPLAG